MSGLIAERLSNVRFLMHPVERRHIGGDVIGDIAMVHSLAQIVSQHVGQLHACRQKFGNIGIFAVDFHEFAVPMRRMQINLHRGSAFCINGVVRPFFKTESKRMAPGR